LLRAERQGLQPGLKMHIDWQRLIERVAAFHDGFAAIGKAEEGAMGALFDLLKEAAGEESVNEGSDLRLGERCEEAKGAERVEAILLDVFGLRTNEHAGDELFAEAAFGAGNAGKDDTDGSEGFCVWNRLVVEGCRSFWC